MILKYQYYNIGIVLMNYKRQIAERIKQLRTERKLTVESLAWGGGLSKSTISNAEKALSSANLKTIISVCISLKISLAEFFSTFTEIPEISEDE